ncbi:hypothetical protein BOX15_Mlig016526g1 [Macrostomum lignano]|uniref:C2H2-type domain-containing protein n=1 Tax=Macrostomum lignano TaxID=282301 RepID=A0A267E1A9_9PLAT|nr:hypothetical protein BOX15_Mlig016526g1 [Macrostomum lignano]
MSAAEPVIPQQQQQQPAEHTLSDSFASSGSDWNLLGDLMIDLSSADQQQPPPPPALKMPATEAPAAPSETPALGPKPEPAAQPDKSLKMKIKRKSKHEEKHEIVAAEAPPARDDSAGPNAKKARVDKADNGKKKTATQPGSQQARRDASVNTATVGTSVEPDQLGPCDTGTNISLDGIVWLETTTGLLVVNVTWRGRTYVGTLLDSSQHEFAPPCPKDYVPPMETSSSRNARGRGKRRPPGCGGGNGGGGSSGVNGVARGSRRLGRQLPLSSRGSDESDEGSRQDGKEDGSKSQSPPAQLPGDAQQQQSGDDAQLPDQPHIKCPELGCDKRFSQLQALKWHTIRHHGELRPSLACAADLLQAEQLREIKSLDGSSVFKVPQQRIAAQQQQPPPVAAARTSPSKTVTVSKTCPVPTAAGQAKPVKEDKAAPPAQGPFKPIQPKPELLEAAAAEPAPLVNGAVTDFAKKKKQRRSPERPPALAPKMAPTGSGQRAKCSRRSDPVSPAYSDISDEGSAPLLEKEEPPASPPPPPPPPPSAAQPLTSLTPQLKTSAAPPAAIVSPLPQSHRPRLPASPTVASKPAAAHHATPRGSPNAPQKPSLGHSPSEDTAKQAEERRQILAENSDIREQQQQQQQQQHQLKEPPRTPQLQSPSSCRPSSRQSVPPPPISAASAFMGALAPPPPFPAGPPGGFPDYRLLGRGFDCGQFMSPFLHDKASMEALGYARSPFIMQQQLQQQQQQQQQHKIHELAAGSVSPGPAKPRRRTACRITELRRRRLHRRLSSRRCRRTAWARRSTGPAWWSPS